ncbi:glycoside hydrolase family 92 protein [Aspergillus saccharolyticus JOP 1030-1]|uniref:Alpha-1,2-mannosidase family protein n=1 Tax=Aspergillus saccharolyticus JOP 1030-1 TaxID=1450539 RepID=A0A318ZAH0_9EURO|nr:alpha-1,2-mannosidase family protein [Aspergillus saccharolyticus JOP 1030-1]PYH44441.1 alpha-1,2-mannosidase family protein [Aspergillus saccharolyticus JOP 1030-1]
MLLIPFEMAFWSSISLLWALPLVLASSDPLSEVTGDYDVLQYVNPLIGSANGGNVFAGATIPYGMAKAVADTDSQNNQGGFAFDGSRITGFSSLHDSGTGGQPSLGNFPLFPYTSCQNDDVNGCLYPKKERKTSYDPASVHSSPGYFGLTMSSGIQVDMTATHHTSLFRFRFPVNASSSPLILLDLSDLSDTRQDNGSISVDAKTGRMTGHARFLPSFGSGSYVPYFCADYQSTSEIRDTGIFVDARASTEVKTLTISRSINGYPLPGGAFIRFRPASENTIQARVGLSFISSEKACQNAEAELADFDFNKTHAAAVKLWTEKMAPIRVSRNGVNSTTLTNFYSGIYRTMVNPQDYTGENPLWESKEPYFDSFYCLWDSFRSQLPFLTIFDPASVTRMVRSLIDTQRHLGWLPDCRMSLCKGFTQGGSNADVVLADAYVKNLTDGIDWEAGYAAVQKDAEEEPFDWSNEGRGGLQSWKALNYIPVEDFDFIGFGTLTRSISRTLEYAYNDFTIAQMARGLGKTSDAEKYESTAKYWQNLFRADQTSFLNGTNTGFTGFFQPKYLNGTWGYQDPLTCSNIDTSGRSCSLQNNAAETFESSIWEYQFFVPHDMSTLVTLLGGPDRFTARLDYLHDRGITYIGNEPAFLTVFQYHYAGRPGKSTQRAHAYIPAFFNPTPTGLPGNDDSGAMGSFVAMTMMGLFPNPGQNVYLITAPFFESVNITSPGTRKTARVRTIGFDPSYQAVFIQSATLDGQPYNKSYVGHDFFTEGRELVLWLGRNESSWGTGAGDLPPSLGTEGDATLNFRGV